MGKQITTIQAALILGCSAIRVRQFCQEGRLKAEKAGVFWLIDEKSALALAAKERPPYRPKKQ